MQTHVDRQTERVYADTGGQTNRGYADIGGQAEREGVYRHVD